MTFLDLYFEIDPSISFHEKSQKLCKRMTSAEILILKIEILVMKMKNLGIVSAGLLLDISQSTQNLVSFLVTIS